MKFNWIKLENITLEKEKKRNEKNTNPTYF